MVCNTANFAIDLIPSKYRDSVAEISDYDFQLLFFKCAHLSLTSVTHTAVSPVVANISISS